MTVLGMESSKAIAGIAGMGHMLLTAGLILLLLTLRKPVFGASRLEKTDAAGSRTLAEITPTA
jgi:predicted lipid-binding transport protein (Tim44 family)